MTTPDPLSLRLFVSVAESGTIAGAAEREHIAAAAVSKRISEIEAQLGVPLLRRTNKGVETTAAGARLVALAHRALHELDDIAVQMRDYASGVTGLIRLAANVSSVVQFLPRELRLFIEQHPRIQISSRRSPAQAWSKQSPRTRWTLAFSRRCHTVTKCGPTRIITTA